MTDIELKLNAWTSNPGTTVFCVQGEQQARTLHVTLIDRTGIQDVMSVAPVTPRYIDLTGYTPRMYVSKPDETGVYFPGTVTDAENGRVDFTLTGQCVAVPGKAYCTISLIKEDIELKIVGIVLDIKKSDTDDFIEGSRDEFVELEVLTSQAKEATAECIAATERAEQAVEAANEVVQADHAIVEDAKTQAASAKEAAALANVATQSANSATSSAQSAADRANAAADRLEGTDVGTLANELDAHTGSQVNTDLGVHGMRINGGQLQVGDDSSWRNAIDKTYTNPQELPDRSTLVSAPPGVYIGKNPKDLDLAGNTQYILVVCKSGTATSRSVTFPLEDKRYTYSVTNKKWVQPRDVVEEGDSGTLHYIKYSDGTAECWGTIQKSVGFYVKTSSLYLTENSEIETPIPYPEHASISVDEPWCWCNYNEANGKNIKFRVFYADLTDPGKKTLSVHIKVTGHWK